MDATIVVYTYKDVTHFMTMDFCIEAEGTFYGTTSRCVCQSMITSYGHNTDHSFSMRWLPFPACFFRCPLIFDTSFKMQ